MKTLTGKSSLASFSRRVKCLTVSNALLKSKEMTATNGFESSMVVIVLIRLISAAAGDPVGRKAN